MYISMPQRVYVDNKKKTLKFGAFRGMSLTDTYTYPRGDPSLHILTYFCFNDNCPCSADLILTQGIEFPLGQSTWSIDVINPGDQSTRLYIIYTIKLKTQTTHNRPAVTPNDIGEN